MVYVEQKNEASAHASFAAMHAVAKEIHDPAALALASVGLGMGQARRENHAEAVRYLEAARHCTFETSRQLTGMVLSFLARAYAKDHDRYRFEQAIDTALHIAARLNGAYSNGADFSSHSLSDILEEESNGYVELGLGRETLAQRQKIERVIEAENNNYMRAWLPLDFAQAYMTMGEAEESIKELRDFYGRIQTLLQSPLGLAKVTAHMRGLSARGYGEVREVKEFAEALQEERRA